MWTKGAAVSFTLDQAYTNVSISADLICIGCLGEVILMRDLIGPTSTLVNFVTGAFLDPTSSVEPLPQRSLPVRRHLFRHRRDHR